MMKGVIFPLWVRMVVIAILGPAAQAQTFEQVTLGALGSVESSSASAVWADYDGDQDVFVTNPFYANFLYRNDGDKGFTIIEEAFGFDANNYASGWADFDNDGLQDLFLSSLGFGQLVYKNEGSGFGVLNGVNLSGVRDMDFADFDGDGDLDIAIARRFGAPDVLMRNEGGFEFSVLDDALPGSFDDGATPAWGDFDNDGDADLFIANSLNGSGRNVLYENTGESFVRVAPDPLGATPGRWQSANWVDFDNDLDLDLFVSNF